jgi:hypothetical protein
MHDPDAPGIGTLNEGSLHRGLKDWLAEPGDRFEVPLAGFVVDLVRGDLLIEIQTGSLGALGPKLDHLLDHHRIRVVHPIVVTRWLQVGEAKPRRSPVRGGVWNVFDALVSLPTLLDHPGLELQIALVEVTEQRSATERVRRGRRGRVLDRRLERVVDHHLFTGGAQLLALLPRDLPSPFTAADLARREGLPAALARRACYVLRHIGGITEVDRTRAGVRYRDARA